MDPLLADLRFALRSFRRARALTAMAVVTIALGVGASTAVFSLLDAVLLQPLPYPDASRIVHLWHDGAVSKAVMTRMMERASSLGSPTGTIEARRTLTGSDEPEELTGLAVTTGYWTLFGARPAAGSLPLNASTAPGQEPVVVLGYQLWQRRFGASPDIVGTTVTLSDRAVTVVGVMHAEFVPLDPATEFWVPMEIDPDDFSDYEGYGQVSLYGRLGAGMTLQAATDDLHAAAAMERQAAPDAYSEEWVARSAPVPLHDVLVQGTRGALWTTMGAVLLILLIACSNVANLLLARAGSRAREMAVRIGLGAGRRRIVRQMLTESLLLALAGGTLGALLAFGVTERLGAAMVGLLPRIETLQVDASMLGFALLATVAASLLFGLAPALRASAVSPRAHLADGGNAGQSARNRRLASLIVGIEVALSVVLVIAAGLMLRTMIELVSVDPGFRSEGVTTFRLRIPAVAGDVEASRARYVEATRERLAALPGVDAVGAATFPPMAAGVASAVYWVEGRERPADEPPANASFQLVAGDYFDVLGIPLRRGRLFGSADDAGSAIVGLLNETMARTVFGDEDPIGRRINMFGGTVFEVIGVVGDVHQRSPDRAPEPEAYFAFEQVPFWSSIFMTLRSAGPPLSAAAIRAAVWDVDPDVPILDLRTMDEVVAAASGGTRLFARILGGFGALALVLAAIGVYGVSNQLLSDRRREFGIRLALGATPASIVRGALGRSLALVLSAAAAGVVGAAALSTLLRGLLYAVSPVDPVTFLAVPTLLIAVGMTAAYFPARRAAKVDPVESLRGR